MNIPKPTEKELEQGYSLCATCNKCILLHQAGFEVDLHACAVCKQMVADKEDFFKFKTGMEVLSK